MVVFQPLHLNDTVSASSTATLPLSDTLVTQQQQQRQLRSTSRKEKTKKKQQKLTQPDNNDATAIPINLTYTVDTTISHERHLILYHSKVMEHCNDAFCMDVVQFIQPSLNRILSSPPASSLSSQPITSQRQQKKYDELQNTDKFPILFQFGDAELYRSYVPARQQDVYSPMVPVIRKYRYSITASDLDQITSGRVTKTVNSSNYNDEQQQEPLQCYSSEERRIIAGTVRNPTPKTQAIISIVSNYPRHFEPLNHVNDADIAWENKFNMAVYRGALTGRNKADYKSSDLKFCVQVPRCNLVYQHGNSSLVDAMLVPYGKMKYPLSDPLNGVKMFGNPMSMEEMLQYKAIIMLEGNDVSSGLKWALFSNSVVLTQAPTCTSWAMEELLVPWVHYIPINDDLSDVEEKVQWILDHDDMAQTIARNGRLWIADLVYHPDADRENEMINDETLRRYRSHFAYNPSLEA
jgi:Glycosyl transferase family 90